MTNKRRKQLQARLYAYSGLASAPWDIDQWSDDELEYTHAKIMAIPELARLLPPLETEH